MGINHLFGAVRQLNAPNRKQGVARAAWLRYFEHG